ncbi:MAG: hypothetical protein ACJ72Z_11140 [Pyrinomonadaceae bacterium]
MDTSLALFEIEYLEHPEYLHARITAPHIDRPMAMSYLSEVMTECAKRRLKKLLLERLTPAVLPQDELSNTMDYLISMDSGTRIAFLSPHSTVAESMQHVVDHGEGKDGAYRYFQSFDEAEKWLLEGAG